MTITDIIIISVINQHFDILCLHIVVRIFNLSHTYTQALRNSQNDTTGMNGSASNGGASIWMPNTGNGAIGSGSLFDSFNNSSSPFAANNHGGDHWSLGGNVPSHHMFGPLAQQ